MTIETKYNVGDEVWFVHSDSVVSDKISAIRVDSTEKSTTIHYTLKTARKINGSADCFVIGRNESHLYPTKADLLNSL